MKTTSVLAFLAVAFTVSAAPVADPNANPPPPAKQYYEPPSKVHYTPPKEHYVPPKKGSYKSSEYDEKSAHSSSYGGSSYGGSSYGGSSKSSYDPNSGPAPAGPCAGNTQLAACCDSSDCSPLSDDTLTGLLGIGAGVNALNSACPQNQVISCCDQSAGGSGLVGGLFNINTCGPLVNIGNL